MKITYRIPNKPDMFAYLVEIEAKGINDTPNNQESDLIAGAYTVFSNAFKPQEGLTAKELDLIIEKMCLGTTVEGGTELWSKATQAQKDQINCLKRALKRIEAKQGHNRDKEMYEGLDKSDTKND